MGFSLATLVDVKLIMRLDDNGGNAYHGNGGREWSMIIQEIEGNMRGGAFANANNPSS